MPHDTKAGASAAMTAHTPCPWIVEDGRIYDGEGRNVCDMAGEGIALDEYDEANAKFICLAVNSHADLLNAARIGLAACTVWGGKCEANGEKILAAASVTQAEIIRAAIIKATERAAK